MVTGQSSDDKLIGLQADSERYWLGRAWEATRKNWPVWVVSLATLANGLFDIFGTLSLRYVQHPYLFGLFFPFGIYHWSRSFTILLGFVLAYLSFHLLQRRRVAWWLATIGTGIALLVHITQWQYWYKIVASLVALGLLLIYRGRFSVRSEPESIKRGFIFAAISVVLAILYGTVGFWLLDKRDFGITFSPANALLRTLRQFSLVGNSDLTPFTFYARWFLESLSVLGIVAAGFVVYSLFRPIAYRIAVLPRIRDEAGSILGKYGSSSYDYFKIWPDKSYFFSESRNTFISYRTVGGVALVLGDAVGPETELEITTLSFLRYCSDNGWSASFLVSELTEMYQRIGLSLLKIGEDAIVDLQEFTNNTIKEKYFRHIKRRFDREGFQHIRYKPPHAPQLIDEVEEISNEWLTLPHHKEFGFFQGKFERNYVALNNIYVIRESSGRAIAFVNEIPSYSPGEATFDMMRHRPDAHPGTMDYLFTTLMEILRDEGYRLLNLGMAPFAGVAESPNPTILERAVHQLSEHLNRFVSAKGLRQYKSKFKPNWQPRYIAYQGGPVGLLRTGIALNQAL
jgi:phosphatidylglycerol lysyltransferase